MRGGLAGNLLHHLRTVFDGFEMGLALACNAFGVDELEDLGHGAMPVLEKLLHTQGQLGILPAEVGKPELEILRRRRDVDRLKREPCLGCQTEDMSISSTYVRNRRRGSGEVSNQSGFRCVTFHTSVFSPSSTTKR